MNDALGHTPVVPEEYMMYTRMIEGQLGRKFDLIRRALAKKSREDDTDLSRPVRSGRSLA